MIASAIYATSQPDNRAGLGEPGARSRPKLDSNRQTFHRSWLGAPPTVCHKARSPAPKPRIGFAGLDLRALSMSSAQYRP
jgi:hypothetical protein